MRTRVFRSGNSQAVRIPCELQLPPDVKEVEIEAQPWGFVIRRPAESGMKLSEIFAAMGPNWFPDGKRPDPGEEADRDWGRWGNNNAVATTGEAKS
ncbi:MAG: hypothetical protein Q8L56_14760 [Rhodocyclaceae bacterium]|nr:hypothetical protein [Rhodocyclaceae bacterium]MDP1956772.1 hypothetical protein [Rhodocyclaceae bacterium]